MMPYAVTSTSVVFCFALVATLANGNRLKRLPPPNCATVMCRDPCPAGQYLRMTEDGCETCDCYDPCEGFECEVGECHWMLGENTRPVNFCVDCRGGQTWSECTGGSDCVATCANPTPVCNRNCYPGCQCPLERPVLHHGLCITAEECRGACEGGQEWNENGVENVATCKNLYPFNSRAGSVGRCQCPSDRPVWDADRSLCVTKNQCIQFYYQEKRKPDTAADGDESAWN